MLCFVGIDYDRVPPLVDRLGLVFGCSCGGLVWFGFWFGLFCLLFVILFIVCGGLVCDGARGGFGCLLDLLFCGVLVWIWVYCCLWLILWCLKVAARDRIAPSLGALFCEVCLGPTIFGILGLAWILLTVVDRGIIWGWWWWSGLMF